MAMHQWFYMKSGIIADESVGPLTQEEFFRVMRDGKVKRDNLISSPTLTKGNWISLDSVPKLLTIWVQYDDERRAKAAADAEAKRQHNAAISQQKTADKAKANQLDRERRAVEQASKAAADERQRLRQEEMHHEQNLAWQRQLATQPAPESPAPQQPQQYQPVAAPVTFVQPQAHHSSTVVIAGGQSQVVPALVNAFCFWPGVGQLIQGRVGAAILFSLCWWVSVALCFVLVGFFLLPVVWVWAIADAALYKPSMTVIRA